MFRTWYLQFDFMYENYMANCLKWNHFDYMYTMTSSVTSQRDFEYCPLYSCLRDGGSGGTFWSQYFRKQCKYRNHISRLYITKEYLMKYIFLGKRSKSQGDQVPLTRKSTWLCHFLSIRIKQTTRCRATVWVVLWWQPRFCFALGSHDH